MTDDRANPEVSNQKPRIRRTRTLKSASEAGDIDSILEHLRNGADVNAITKAGHFALGGAVINGHGEAVAILLEYGADVNHQSEYGWTPLYLATWKGHAEIAARLLEAGALADKRTKPGYGSPDGWTALHVASAGRHLNVVRTLAEAGVSLRAKTRNGVSALELAAENGHRKVVAYLQRQAARRSRRN